MNRKMTDRSIAPAATSACAQGHRGFTMVELMVVLLILGLLVAMTAGIAKYLRESGAKSKTTTTESILTGAIEAFIRNNGVAPKDPAAYTDRKGKVADSNQFVQNQDTLAQFGTRVSDFGSDANWAMWPYWGPMQRNSYLYYQLINDAAATSILRTLPQDAVMIDPNGQHVAIVMPGPPTTGGIGTGFIDGYLRYMDYRSIGGAGGRYVVISGGPDGYIYNSWPAGSLYRPNGSDGKPLDTAFGGTADDIRTDGKPRD